MAKKISELTATSTIASTDLLEVSKDNGLGGYDSRKITYGDLTSTIQSNPRCLDVMLGNNITGTTSMTKSGSILIPANTITGPSVLDIISRGIRVSGTAATMYHQMFKNTSDSLTGATLIGIFTTLTTAQYFSQGTRQALIIPNTNTMKIFSASGTTATDYLSSSAASSITFDETVDNYIIFAMQPFNVGDTAAVEFSKITLYE